MMSRKSLIILLMGLLFLICISTVSAEEVTMRVDSKHIVGTGTGNTPLLPDEYCNVVYVVSEISGGYGGPYILQEYPVSLDDYCKIKIGDRITLEKPEYRTDSWKVIKIE